jgi:hypothetical protein
MGAESFYEVASGKTVKEAFDSAVEDAAYEHGHGGYTGTIAEKHEYKQASPKTFESLQDAQEFADRKMDGDHWCNDKWGAAAYVAFKDGDQIKYLFFGWASS